MAGRGGLEGLGADRDELEDEARYEWIDRGLDPDEFSIRKMELIWEREEREAKNFVNPYRSDLQSKLDRLGGKRDIDKKPPLKLPTSDQIIKFAGKSYEKARMQAKVLAAKGARFVEPPFARKLRKAREHRERIDQQQTEGKLYYYHPISFIDESIDEHNVQILFLLKSNFIASLIKK